MLVQASDYPGWDGQNYSGYEYNYATGEWELSSVAAAAGKLVMVRA